MTETFVLPVYNQKLFDDIMKKIGRPKGHPRINPADFAEESQPVRCVAQDPFWAYHDAKTEITFRDGLIAVLTSKGRGSPFDASYHEHDYVATFFSPESTPLATFFAHLPDVRPTLFGSLPETIPKNDLASYKARLGNLALFGNVDTYVLNNRTIRQPQFEAFKEATDVAESLMNCFKKTADRKIEKFSRRAALCHQSRIEREKTSFDISYSPNIAVEIGTK